jgi:transposase
MLKLVRNWKVLKRNNAPKAGMMTKGVTKKATSANMPYLRIRLYSVHFNA